MHHMLYEGAPWAVKQNSFQVLLLFGITTDIYYWLLHWWVSFIYLGILVETNISCTWDLCRVRPYFCFAVLRYADQVKMTLVPKKCHVACTSKHALICFLPVERLLCSQSSCILCIYSTRLTAVTPASYRCFYHIAIWFILKRVSSMHTNCLPNQV